MLLHPREDELNRYGLRTMPREELRFQKEINEYERLQLDFAAGLCKEHDLQQLNELADVLGPELTVPIRGLW